MHNEKISFEEALRQAQEKGFAEADEIVDVTYQTTQIQHTPLEPHVCYAHVEGGRLVVNASTQVPYHLRRIISWVCGTRDMTALNLVVRPEVLDETGAVVQAGITIGFGTFVATIIDFILIAMVVFAVVKAMNVAKSLTEKKAEEETEDQQ